MKIDRECYTPISRQLYDILCSRILDRVYDIGENLPSQKHLAEEFQVSMITVRRAFSDLVNQGIIKTNKGKGSCVISYPEVQHKNFLHTASGFTTDSQTKDINLETKILNIEYNHRYIVANINFQIDRKLNLIFINRLRLVNGRPIALEFTYLNPILFDRPSRFSLLTHNASLYKFITSQYKFSLERAEENIQPILPNADIMDILQIKKQAPIFFIKRCTFFANCKSPFEYCENYILSKYYGDIVYPITDSNIT